MRPAFLLVSLALLPARAEVPLRWGFGLGAVSAQGDLLNAVGHRLAPEGMLWAAWQVNASFALRPTLEYQRFPVAHSGYVYKSTRYNDFGEENARWSAWTVGMDACYHPGSGRLGFVGGVAMKAWKVRSYGSFTSIDKTNGTQSYSVDDTTTKNESALSAGLSWDWTRHLTTEARVTFGSYRKQAYNTLQIRVLWAF